MKKTLQFKAGEVIMQEGEFGKGFYILETGLLAVIKNGTTIAEIKEPGTIFGEMSDILSEPRTCTILAKKESSVIHIPKTIDEIVDLYPSIAKKLIFTLAKRLEDTTKNLLVFKTDESIHNIK